MKQLTMISVGLLFIIFTSCNKTKGCMDMNALNFDASAEQDNGSCKFSAITFYASFGYYNGVPINSIDVSVNGNTIGTINAIYPTGPGNCGAQGTVPYSFSNNSSYDWNTVVHLADGQTVFGSGTISPMAGVPCVKVNVTR
jgi:hypothetical protein